MTNCRFLNRPENQTTTSALPRETPCCYASGGRVVRNGFREYCIGNPELCAVHRITEDKRIPVTASEHVGLNYEK